MKLSLCESKVPPDEGTGKEGGRLHRSEVVAIDDIYIR